MNETQKTWSNPWIYLAFIGVILFFSLLGLAILREKFVNEDNWQLSFSGQGRIKYEPDIAKVNMGVKIDNKEKAEDALKELDGKITKIIEAVKKSGIEDKNIQTLDYILSPHYEIKNEQSVQSGYDANQIIVVKVDDVFKNKNKLQSIIKDSSQAGVNQINGVSFEPSNLEELKQKARLMAVNDAKQKAISLSNELGVKLDKIVGWWENYLPGPVPYYGDIGGGKGGTGVVSSNISGGEQEILIEVNISYLIDEK